MKTPIRLVSILICSMGLWACGESHFLKEKSYREQVYADLAKKKELLPNGNLFAVLDDSTLTVTEQEALTFLYAYMPIGDMADYPGDYYLDNVRLTLQIREEMPWGKLIPDEVFRHFVLPVRVNNENLDDARGVFYAELKERVEGLSMEDAILEVNHWCHEKVIYTPSDARTSSPLATVKTAYGRCGEESTFTVAALRAVGIPARQVYTPRWAHTDDNHAWVEAWANGQWHFMGACEPEPVLDLGWFNAPASRGMLMHTKVFGRYNGPEEIMLETPNYTEINVIGNYAQTAKAAVRVLGKDGNPVSDAKVEFKLYNYAEFYTVATKRTSSEGIASLTAGRGDMLVWASKDGSFGYSKLAFGKDETLDIILNKMEGETYSLQVDITPPVEGVTQPVVTPEQREENTRRLAQEDSIRNVYVATFMNNERASRLVDTLIQLNNSIMGDESVRFTAGRPSTVARMLVDSRGNYQTLTNFLSTAAGNGKLNNAFCLLSNLSTKDLRDVLPEILNDHFIYTSKEYTTNRHLRADFNPRVANEMLTPYRSFFRNMLSVDEAKNYYRNPQLLVEWCKNNITIHDELNSQRIPISPIGVWNARVADELSRNIFFVAMARSVGLWSWIDEATGKVQYVQQPKHIDVDFPHRGIEIIDIGNDISVFDVNFEASELKISPSGVVRMFYQPLPYLDDPRYYTHFTLSRFEKGIPYLLSYDDEIYPGRPTSWNNKFKYNNQVDAGYYMLTAGTRLASGKVLCNISFFNVKEGEEKGIDLVMRDSKDDIRVIGNFNSESTFRLADSGTVQSVLQANGRGYYVVGILGVGQEPTNHALRDLAAVANDLEKWGKKLILLFPDENQYSRFQVSDFPGLPSTIIYGIDTDGAIQKQITEEMKLSAHSSLPIFIIGDTFNRVVFVSQGYTIGLGEQLMKVISRL